MYDATSYLPPDVWKWEKENGGGSRLKAKAKAKAKGCSRGDETRTIPLLVPAYSLA